MSTTGNPPQSSPSLPVGVNLVIVLVTLATYVPSLMASEINAWPTWKLVLFVLMGLVYVGVGTKGWEWLVARNYSGAGIAAYFIIQVSVAMFAMWLAFDLPTNTWLLMMPLVGQSLVFPWWGALIVSGGILGIFALLLLANGVHVDSLMGTMTGLTTASVFVLIFSYVAVREEEARGEIERLAAQLQGANDQLRQYAVQAEELATTKERNRLAREIHDSLGHYLTVINVQLGAAQAVLQQNPERALDALQKSQKLAQDGLAEVRRSVAALRESPIDNRTLQDAIQELVAESRTAGIVTQFEQHGIERALPPQAKLTLYRAVQEGLTNARKHANASRVDVTVDFREADRVQLLVADNGVGATEASGGFGLLGLQERVQLLAGEMATATTVGAGFTLRVSIPTPESEV